MPLSSSAKPMTIAKVATRSAKKAVLSAVVSAVSVTQIWRAWLATGFLVWGSMAATALSWSALPLASRYWPICE